MFEVNLDKQFHIIIFRHIFPAMLYNTVMYAVELITVYDANNFNN